MQFEEMGRKDGKTLVLLPGTPALGKVNFARLLTWMITPLFNGAVKSEKKRQKLADKLGKAIYPDMDDDTKSFLEGFAASFEHMNPKTIPREFYSDYVTPLNDDIHCDGTTIHVIHALKMDPKGKYEKRYLE